MKEILHLTLKRKWFDLIKSGDKKVEYREAKPYWIKRLYGRRFDEIYFRNGYSPDSPFIRVQCLDIVRVADMFEIRLGDILEVCDDRDKARPEKRNPEQPIR